MFLFVALGVAENCAIEFNEVLGHVRDMFVLEFVLIDNNYISWSMRITYILCQSFNYL